MKNMKLIRVLREYSQIKVQMETGIRQSLISRYESGDAIQTGGNLMILAKYYNTSIDFLMDLTDEQKPYPPKKTY